MTRQGGHGREGRERNMWGQVTPSTVTFLRGFGEGLNDGSLIVLLLLNVEGQPLPQVVATGTTALCLRPRYRFTVGAGKQEGSGRKERGERGGCFLVLGGRFTTLS